MHDLTSFTTFVTEQYGMHPVAIHSLGLNNSESYRLYRVDLANGLSWVLRAYQQDKMVPTWFGGSVAPDWLLDRATTLVYLAQQDYPAPRVIPTRTGALLGTHEGCCGLMTSFVQGDMMENTPERLRLLASTLGHLHMLHPQSATAVLPPVANSWWYPESALVRPLEQLASVVSRVPTAWKALHEAFGNTLHTILQRADLPITIIHGDCWPENAVQVSDEQVMLIDWECAGWGMAVLDLGGLLIDCHPNPAPTQPIQADPDRITAVVDGYCQQRMLGRAEVDALLEAMRFGVAFMGAIRFAWTQQEGWSERIERSLTRLQKRFVACEDVAALARERFEQLL